jgi:hypothetical protein
MEPVERLPEDTLISIDRALLERRPVSAIRRYREATGAHLRDATRAIDERARQIGVVWKRPLWSWRRFLILLALTFAIFLINTWIARH